MKGSKLSVRELERAHSAHLLWNGTSGCQELARVGSKKVCRRFLPLQSRNVPEVRAGGFLVGALAPDGIKEGRNKLG